MNKDRSECIIFTMKKLIGFVLIWISVGMVFMMFLPNLFWGILFSVLLFFVGYRLFSCDC